MPRLWRRFEVGPRRRITVTVFVRNREWFAIRITLGRRICRGWFYDHVNAVKLRSDPEAEAIAAALCRGDCDPQVFADWLEDNVPRLRVSRATRAALPEAAAWLREAKPSSPLSIHGPR